MGEPIGAPRAQPAHGNDLLAELSWRGLVQESSQGLEARLARGPISGYIGFDASATSLHVGHLLQVFLLTHLQKAGGRPVVVIGGATGMIGDPSGKSSERKLLDDEAISRNAAAIKGQLESFLDFAPGPTEPLMVDNREWLGKYTMLEFLREIGKHFSIPYMLAKDSVQQRLAAGMSFTEFSYMTLQSADFLHLHRDRGVELQLGGADQWGNITAGLELIRRVEGREEGEEASSFGLVSPLLLTRAGVKMGKSERGAVYLDPALTSPYEFYQYWLNDDDLLVMQHVRWLTLLSADEVAAIAAEQEARPGERAGHKALAFDLTARIHGREEAVAQRRIAEAYAAGQRLSPNDLEVLARFADPLQEPTESSPKHFLVRNAIASNLHEAESILQNRSAWVNGDRLGATADVVPSSEGWLVVRVGQRHWAANVTDPAATKPADRSSGELSSAVAHFRLLARKRNLRGVSAEQNLVRFVLEWLKSFGVSTPVSDVRTERGRTDLAFDLSDGRRVVLEVKGAGSPVGTVEQLRALEASARDLSATFAILTNFAKTYLADMRSGSLEVRRVIDWEELEELYRSIPSLPNKFEGLLKTLED